ncbi:MAG: ABC transporter ATP-binding protein [Desulfobacteraceae bacterium]|nr:ABC transporter ATP-binding protein [Desulfobacteraceae bacterium]
MYILQVQNLSKSFGGLQANRSIGFDVAQGEMLGVIGPNGAGKTTLFNCIAGVHQIDSGRVIFQGRRISGMKSHEIARLGLARTFQIYVASGDLNVKENIMVGCFMRERVRSAAAKAADETLGLFQISHLAKNVVAELPIAAQKRVAMATALATGPRLLLLDEVAAGLNPNEVDEITGLIRSIHAKLGVTIILIEHVMEMVLNICDRVIVLDYGEKISEGTPREVIREPAVIKAYLGERYARQYLEQAENR